MENLCKKLWNIGFDCIMMSKGNYDLIIEKAKK